jgi:hypothetical protein
MNIKQLQVLDQTAKVTLPANKRIPAIQRKV